MPFGSAYTRTKTFAAGGTYLPSDLNSIQDDLGAQAQALAIANGVTDTVVRRGAAATDTASTRNNGAFGLLSPADQVQNVVLPTDGLLVIGYQALWKVTTGSGIAAIFIGANQLKLGASIGAPSPQQVSTIQTAYSALGTFPGGLATATALAAQQNDVQDGMPIGAVESTGVNKFGLVHVFATAGTYNISVQFASAGGVVTAKNRHLWVYSMGF